MIADLCCHDYVSATVDSTVISGYASFAEDQQNQDCTKLREVQILLSPNYLLFARARYHMTGMLLTYTNLLA